MFPQITVHRNFCSTSRRIRRCLLEAFLVVCALDLGMRMPRLPALCSICQNAEWRLPAQSDPLDCLEEAIEGDQVWRRSYSTLAHLPEQVTAVLEDQAERGQVLRLTEEEARRTYPHLSGCIGEGQSERQSQWTDFGESPVRRVERHTREWKDAHPRPGVSLQCAADLRRAVREKSKIGQKTFARTADVAQAHRQVPMLRIAIGTSWGPKSNLALPFTSTRLEHSGSRLRVTAGLGCRRPLGVWRSAWWVMLHTCGTCLVADNFQPEASGPSYRASLMVFFLLCTVCGVPLSWNKTAGGDTVIWVGFELLLHSYQLGISARRAEWLTKRAREVACSTYIQMNKFEEGLGRVVYVAGALEFERPFLGPLYKFLTIHPRGSVRRVPPYVAFILKYIAHQVERSRHYPGASDMFSSEVARRLDAQASGERTGIGGWYPVLGEDGQPESEEVTVVLPGDPA